MKKTKYVLFLLLILLPMTLAACGGDVSEGDAEKMLKAAFTGDREEANKFLCEDDQIPEGQGAPDGFTVEDVSCKKDGDKMNCSASVGMAGQMAPVEMSFDIKDGKLCGGNLGN